MDNLQLSQLQALDLETKIMKTKARIREWYYHWGGEVYISFSGGKDSTVLLDIVRQEFPDIEAVFVDTGLEYPEIRKFVNTFDNVTILKPKMSFKEVVEKYGYPVISKEVAIKVHELARTKSEYLKIKYIEGLRRDGTLTHFKLSKKWYFLLEAPFKISHQCCNIMKKNPIKIYEKSGKVPFIGTMAQESRVRLQLYLKNNCNSFNTKRPTSQPLSFWTEQDILLYIKKNNLPICSVYGDIIEDENGKLKTTGESRTGCYACMFGITHDRTPNRFQSMKRTHPKLYDYCMREENGLGLAKILNYLQIKY